MQCQGKETLKETPAALVVAGLKKQLSASLAVELVCKMKDRKITISMDEPTQKELGELCAVSGYTEKDMILHSLRMYRANALGCYNLTLRIQNLELQNEEIRKQLPKE